MAAAALADAEVSIETARLNLQRTVVTSPTDGFVNDQVRQVGQYVANGHPALAVVDSHSFRVDGYFEETQLHCVTIGDPAGIKVMGRPEPLQRHAQSIVVAIENRDRQESPKLLPDINPAFSYVRLAQRVPVRIRLDSAPGDVRLIAGRTATVSARRATLPA